MGNILNRNKNDNDLYREVANLKKQLLSITDIDKNNDGIITKDEFDTWKTQQDVRMGDFESSIKVAVTKEYDEKLNKKNIEINDQKQEIAELHKQIESLKSINSGLNNTVDKKYDSISVAYENKLAELSKQRIHEYVQKILDDDNVNIKYLPDFVERQIYTNVFKLILSLMDNVFDQTSINFLGHKISLNCSPRNEIKPNEEDRNGDK